MKTKWSKEFPKTTGDYWFYGYRYGKISCGKPCQKEWMRLKVRKCSNGMMYIAEGQFMDEQEVVEPLFTPIVFPALPK